ncbi:hypothetical protein V5738_03925 [Salinisphaera sp. SPP-AMP-43]|uniref:HoxN/HupN/NixA family nickel/cobalt transporter n=1 Tax=Salinisphaera sp. SPP-AMP-43 TaxID=3121288 RepID=UPI003C6E3E65
MSEQNSQRGLWRLGSLITAVAGLHVLGLGLLLAAASQGTLLFGLGGLAYLLGLRHAFDIDHIAAIDNVTRKLSRDGQQPVFVGFAFSLGHSTVVFGLCVLVTLFARQIGSRMDSVAGVGALIGTVVSAGFLTLIAVVNFQILREMWRRYRSADVSHAANDGSVESLLARRGLLSRWLGRGYRWIDASWKMYPLGLAFGLGFDTATEIALLGLSAAAAQHAGWAPWMILALPVLFAAGMTLMDSINGLLMLRTYRWGDRYGRRRLGFNIAVTGLSVALAFVVGSLEWVQLAAEEWAPNGAIANWLGAVPTAVCGLAVLILFGLVWLTGYGLQQRQNAASRS